MDNLDIFLQNQKKKRKTNESNESYNSYLDKLKETAFSLPSLFNLPVFMSNN